MSDTLVHAQDVLQITNRRLHSRRRMRSLAYIELGGNNGGMIRDISEGGVGVTAAAILADDCVLHMRFELPSSKDWIEANGQIVWIDESKKKAGIRFVDLTEDARSQIRKWISLEEAGGELQRERGPVCEEGRQPSGAVVARPSKSVVAESASLGVVAKKPTQDSIPSAGPPIPLRGTKTPAAVPLPRFHALGTADDSKQKLRERTADVRIDQGVWRRRWLSLPVLVSLFAVISFAAGLAVGRGAWDEVLKIIGKKTGATSESASGVGPARSSTSEPAKDVLPPPADTTGSAPSPTVENTRPSYIGNLPTPPRGTSTAPQRQILNRPSARMAGAREGESSPPLVKPPETPSSTTASAATSSDALTNAKERENSPPVVKPVETPSGAAGPGPAATSADAQADAKERENSPPQVKAPETPSSAAGSVVITSHPYPSIRVPRELKPQTSRLGASLQIGQLISRVKPVYPQEAERQLVEGTVRLHAIIGRDGAVQSVELVSGPPLLVPGSLSAVREWRYEPTLLGGQPIETEQDITILFRLPKQAALPN